MNPIRLINPGDLPRLSIIRPLALLAAIALLSALPASAAEKAYRYYQFKTTKLVGNGSNLMLAEFDFYHGGTKLNIRNKTGVGASIACDATAGDLGPDSPEGSNKLLDGDLTTKMFRSGGLIAGNEVVFDFGATLPHPVIDSYTFTSATDGASYIRTPQSWVVFGSDDKVNWTALTWEVDKVTVLENSVTYGPFGMPEVIPPLINSFSTPTQIVLNNTPVTFSYNTQFSTARNVYSGTNVIPLAAESGTFVTTPPANGQATAYTLAATKDALAASNTAQVRSVAGGASTYQYVRFNITKRRGPGDDSTVQLAEFELYDSAVSAAKIPIAGVTNPGGDSPGAEGADKIIDGITAEGGNKWLDFNNAALIFDFGSPKKFDKYAFFTGGDATERDPIQWTLEGTNDDIYGESVRWNLIENVNIDYMTPVARNASTTPIPLPGPSLPPLIESFTANAIRVFPGSSVTLNWSAQAASSVTISPTPGGTLPSYGTVTVNPTVTTVYSLVANPLAGGGNVATLPQTLTVEVVADPGLTEIDYDDFSNASTELVKVGTTVITPSGSTSPNRLRLTNDDNDQHGAAWFLNKLKVTDGFEVNFGLSMNSVPNNYSPADGIAFVIHNSTSGNAELGTGETGVRENSLNITFRSFGYSPQEGSRIEVTQGAGKNFTPIVLSTTNAYNTPGVELYGLPGVDEAGNIITTGGLPYTLGTMATDPPYRVRIVYVPGEQGEPGDLDVYLDGIAVIQNVEVYLDGVADGVGKSYLGFTARTGGNTQFNDITDWSVKFGDFSEELPFSSVKTAFKHTGGTSKPTAVDLVWNADSVSQYQVLSSPNLIDWTPVKTLTNAAGGFGDSETGVITGLDGQIGATVPIPAEGDGKLFYRVSSSPLVIPD